MIKHYQDDVPPESGRKYVIETDANNQSTITDVTRYQQEGSSFGASDICSVGIIEVTHSKTGTRHNLITDNVAAENVKFTMVLTSNYTYGDTFAFNGVDYTATTIRGDALETGCIKGGNTVFAFVDHTNKIIYFDVSSKPKTIRIRCNNTAATTEKADYKFKQEVSIPGITADYWVYAQVTSGSYPNTYQVESAADKTILWFATQPASNVYITIIYMKTEE